MNLKTRFVTSLKTKKRFAAGCYSPLIVLAFLQCSVSLSVGLRERKKESESVPRDLSFTKRKNTVYRVAINNPEIRKLNISTNSRPTELRFLLAIEIHLKFFLYETDRQITLRI